MPFRPIQPTQQASSFRQLGATREQPQEPGFFKGLVQDITSPLLDIASTGASIAKEIPRGFKIGAGVADIGIKRLLGRDVEQEKEALGRLGMKQPEGVEIDAGFLGKGTPLESLKQSIGAGLQVGLMGVPGLGAGAGLGSKVATGAAIGGGFAGGKALEEDKGLKDILISTAIGLGTGAVVPLAGVGFRKLTQALQKKLPNKLVQFALRQPKASLKAGKDVSSFVVENKKIGTANKLFSDATDEVANLDKQIKSLLESSVTKKSVINKVDVLDDIVGQINKAGGSINKKEVTNIVTKLSPQAKGILQKKVWTPLEANQMRASIDKVLGNRAFLDIQQPFNKEVLLSFANSVRGNVQSKVSATKSLFALQSKEITLRNLANELIAKRGGASSVNLIDFIGGGIGLFGGGPAGALTGFFARRAVQSPLALTTAAQASRGLGKVGEAGLRQLGRAEPVTRRLGPAVVGSLANR